MEMVDKTIQVPKAVDDLGQNLSDFVGAIDKALEDGWQTGDDLPPILAAALANLVPAIQAAKAAGDDFKADPYMSVKGISIHVADIVKAIATKSS